VSRFIHAHQRITLYAVALLLLNVCLCGYGVLGQLPTIQAIGHPIPSLKSAPSKSSGSSTTGLASASFVTRTGSRLLLNGAPFRFEGANIYWLGLDDGAQTYPTPYRIDDAMDAAVEMGATVVRSHSLGVSTGCALCVEPSLGNFNATALQHIDYAIMAARDHGLKLIIPLTDNYHYYHGGKHNFTDWRGISDENQFYSNPQVISDFEQYIGVLLNHVNVYTGVAYKNDPTIMAWETGNELLSPSSWTQTIANYIKSVDGNHLVMDGNYGINQDSLAISSVDIYSDHFYPPNISKMEADAAETQSANKAYVIGEYDWQTTSGDALNAFLSAITANSAISGACFWDLWSHADDSGYRKGDGVYAMYYPGDTADHRNREQVIRNNAYAIQGMVVPPDGIPGAPTIMSVSGKQITWRGASLADTYSIERSTWGANGPWTVVCNQCVTDYSGPWTDATQPPGSVWYRMRAYNRVGVAGQYSVTASVRGGPGGPVVVGAPRILDNLDDWSLSYSHSSNLHFDSSNPIYFNGDSSRAYRWSVSPTSNDYITWHLQGMKTFSAVTYFWPSEPVSNFTIYTSDDNFNWTQANPTIAVTDSNWLQYVYTVSGLWNASYVKIVWNNHNGQSWSPQIGQVSIS
jgi:mannan endo-1,4-beta-mannosidase